MQSAFTMFKQSKQVKDASLRYDKTDFSYIVDHAKLGDKEAIYYLISTSLSPIAKAFLTSYIGNRDIDKEEINEKSHEFFNEFLTYIFRLTIEKKIGPFFKFDPEVFVQNENEFILNKFKYYMYAYAKRLGTHLHRKEMKWKNQEVGEEEFNAVHGGKEGDVNAYEELPDVSAPSPEVNKKTDNPLLDNEEFMAFLKMKRKPEALRGTGTYYDTVMMLANGASLEDISKRYKLNLSRNFSGAWERLNSIKKLYNKFVAKQQGK
jgi:hypothetical protein